MLDWEMRLFVPTGDGRLVLDIPTVLCYITTGYVLDQ